MKDTNLFGHVEIRKLLLKAQNEKKWIQWCFTNRDRTRKDFKNILWMTNPSLKHLKQKINFCSTLCRKKICCQLRKITRGILEPKEAGGVFRKIWCGLLRSPITIRSNFYGRSQYKLSCSLILITYRHVEGFKWELEQYDKIYKSLLVCRYWQKQI